MPFLMTTISRFLPTSSLDRRPGEDGVKASKLGLMGGMGAVGSGRALVCTSFSSRPLSKAEAPPESLPHPRDALHTPKPRPPSLQPRATLSVKITPIPRLALFL